MAAKAEAAAQAAAGPKNKALEELYEGMGTINWWGLSPATDLLAMDARRAALAAKVAAATGADEATGAEAAVPDDGRRDILVAGAGDVRHILKTMAEQRKRPDSAGKPIHFWVAEHSIELLARQMFQMALILEPQENVGIQEKCEMFLETLGNTHIRGRTSEYLAAKSKRLIELVTDPEQMEAKFPLIDIGALKYKERDGLEETFAFWRNPNPPNFDMHELWDYRVRIYLKQRYDARANVADWDYSMKLKPIASIIHTRQFVAWRQTGHAYDLREAPYEIPNRTLASGRVFREKRGSVEKRGYWGDVINSPYIGVAAESDAPGAQELFKMANNVHMKHAADVAQYNVSSYIHEIFTGDVYDATAAAATSAEGSDEGGGGAAAAAATTADDDGEEPKIVEEVDIDDDDLEAAADAPDPALPRGPFGVEGATITQDMPDFHIHFLPMTGLKDCETKSKYRGRFDVAYFSHTMATSVKSEMAAALKPNAQIVMESVKYLLDLKPENKQEFQKKAVLMAATVHAKPVGKQDGATSNHFFFNRRAEGI